MGYAIKIGQKVKMYEDTDDAYDSVKSAFRKNEVSAGLFATTSGGFNILNVSYTSGDRALRVSGLYRRLHNGEDVPHSGAECQIALTKDILALMEESLKQFDASAGPGDAWERHIVNWILDWSRWAVKYCKEPVLIIS